MRKWQAVMLVGLAIALCACAGRKQAQKVPKRVEGIPHWVVVPGKVTVYEKAIEDGEILQGVGMSEPKANFRAMRDTAYADAMRRLGEQVKVKCESVTRVTLGNWSDFLNTDMESSIEETKEMIKTIVDVELQGPKPTQEYQDPDSGRYWVRTLLSSATAEKWAMERLQAQKELHRLFVEAKAAQIAEELGKDIERLEQKEKEQQAALSGILTAPSGE